MSMNWKPARKRLFANTSPSARNAQLSTKPSAVNRNGSGKPCAQFRYRPISVTVSSFASDVKDAVGMFVWRRS
jgi:hypothetical protein